MNPIENLRHVDDDFVPDRVSDAGRSTDAEVLELGASPRGEKSHRTDEVVKSSDTALLLSVIKVSQAISSEIVLEKMLDTVMRIAIEHAGAERGLLILTRDGEQRIAAEVTTGADRIAVQMRDDAVDGGSLPQSVFHYVLRTLESVIVDDASVRGPFTLEPYVGNRRAR